MTYAIGFGMLLAVLVLGMGFNVAKNKFDDRAIERKSRRVGARCPCPSCKSDLYGTLMNKQSSARGGIDRRGLKCTDCGTWSEWETMGDPPVLITTSVPKRAVG